MKEEEKQLLLKDLCARLPYGVICRYETVIPLLGDVLNYGPLQEIRRKGEYFTVNGADCSYEDIKPYLRPMSSMTKKEKNRYDILVEETVYRPGVLTCSSLINFCHKHHLDNLGLIEKGLALEAPEGMYKIK